MGDWARRGAGILCGAVLCLESRGWARETTYSPWNRERPIRKRTDYIILHTTEAPAAGSLNKLRTNGEAHYMIDTAGTVYRIIHHARVALHAGRSMWNGRTDLDTCSIGIETVGCHNRDITDRQYAALARLIEQLQGIYRVPDGRVLPHSMVAYGVPNRWQSSSHRGRKRCGMLFATPAVRARLRLTAAPPEDPDVRAGRLVAGDAYLARVLYGRGGEREQAIARIQADPNVIAPGRSAWDIARERYASADTIYALPDGTKLRGDGVKDWSAIPGGTRVIVSDSQRDNESERVEAIGVDGDSARAIAGDEYSRAETIYFLPDGRVRRGNELDAAALAALPRNTRMLVGYVPGGYVTAKRSAYDICGQQWNYPSTFYRLPDRRIVAGDKVNEASIPKGTQVFLQR